jgi:CMP-N,N'-diacetyllegionaminic acid synthase
VSAPSCVALVPARAGSKRVPGKNTRRLAGHPLLAYSIGAARDSGVFAAVVVSTDSPEVAAISRHYGAEVPFLRPAALAADLSPDIEWVTYTLRELRAAGREYDCFSLIRPTSPFRRPETIRRAWQSFLGAGPVDSLRAVEPCRQHPGKMWVLEGDRMRPLLRGDGTSPPWHSRPYQALPPVYAQNASLEIAWTRTVFDTGTIAGHAIVPFLTEDYEGFDVNEPSDWWYAEHLVASGEATLPAVAAEPWDAAQSGAQ